MKNNISKLKSKTIHIHRLYFDKASVRDYLINDIINRGIDLIIECSNQQMYIPNSLIKVLGKRSNVNVKSKYNDKTYSLIDFPFTPNQIPNSNQYNLFGGQL